MEESVLNPVLYSTLKGRFGKVIVASRGVPASIEHHQAEGRRWPDPRGGEYYRVDCPACNDRRQRMWISHMFGLLDPSTGIRMLNCFICFNCGATAGSSYLKELIAPSFARMNLVRVSALEAKPFKFERVERPDGIYCWIDDLSPTHPARAYVEARGYDCRELRTAQWQFCQQSDHRMICRRIYIPMLHVVDGKLLQVGWQTRAVPGYSVSGTPKYFTLPSFHKSQMIYNLYRAAECPWIALTEGVGDSERVGVNGTALLGKSLSMSQLRLLVTTCPNARVAVMLDADALGFSWKIAEILNSGSFGGQNLKRGAFVVRLPKGDPGDYRREELLEIIREADQRNQT